MGSHRWLRSCWQLRATKGGTVIFLEEHDPRWVNHTPVDGLTPMHIWEALIRFSRLCVDEFLEESGYRIEGEYDHKTCVILYTFVMTIPPPTHTQNPETRGWLSGSIGAAEQ